ncbi:hypothetical protein AB0C15_30290, partial [Micromonospora sp. NPDC048835]
TQRTATPNPRLAESSRGTPQTPGCNRRLKPPQANPAAKGISLEKARRTLPVPLHRGAQKALQDLGAN